ncbi:MAG TPA: DUF1697 domain-containing protein [Daejeonella sp.]|nr:DUF1697 domain-containing protein [Daejeonella sp.]
MTTYISMLRGINVSGHKKILMADLKALYENLNFQNVSTYIQSGNVIFHSDENLSDQQFAEKIRSQIFNQYGFEVPVLIRTLSQLQNTLSSNPFLKQEGIDLEKLHVTFLSEKPNPANLTGIQSNIYLPDEFIISEQEIFLHCPINYGETKLSNKFFESKLKVLATTRNWKTVNKLVEIALGQ